MTLFGVDKATAFISMQYTKFLYVILYVYKKELGTLSNISGWGSCFKLLSQPDDQIVSASSDLRYEIQFAMILNNSLAQKSCCINYISHTVQVFSSLDILMKWYQICLSHDQADILANGNAVFSIDS